MPMTNASSRNSQLQRRGEALQDQADRGLVINETIAEIAVHGAGEERQVLLPEWLVEAESRDDARAVDLIDVLPDQDIDRIPDRMQTDEHDQRHQQHDERRLRDSANEPAAHWSSAYWGGASAGCHSSP
jgi:hypothetical protein